MNANAKIERMELARGKAMLAQKLLIEARDIATELEADERILNEAREQGTEAAKLAGRVATKFEFAAQFHATR